MTGASTPGEAGAPDLPRLLYIMGTARSGSTILEILLGNATGVSNVGEISHIFADGMIRNDECACGRRASDCPLWGEVRRTVGWSDDYVKEIATLTREMDWHTGLFKALIGNGSGAREERYGTAHARLFASIAGASGDRVLAESSLYAARALVLNRTLGSRLKVICMTRDPAGLLRSFRVPNQDEQLPKSTLKVVTYYLAVITAARLAAWRLGNVLHVRFEDFQAAPDATLARIAAWSGVDLAEARARVRDSSPLDAGHIVTGNRVRKERPLRFRARGPEPEPSGWTDRLAVGAMRLWGRLLGFA